MINWLVTGIAAGGAFLLSFLIGLFSDVTAGALFLRAVLWALVFAVFVNAANFILRRFLPDLFEPLEEEMEEQEEIADEGVGEKVNIVVDDGDGEFPSEEPISDPGFTAQGVEELAGGAGEPEPAPAAAPVGGDEDEVQELDAVDEEDAGTPVQPQPISSGSGAIPDISQFEGDFTGGGVETVEEKSSSAQSAEVMGNVYETEEMAQAVHTIMQKDQEG